ncbi:ribosomal protein L1-like protein [Polychytrium aggregatum]|uniref:ribosomal protein L1-like protein n=1 Tax=Polychytrium aggregatum TaxID=110093 RepID=UPI0022FE6879|nr:ribosomal protein L1-like protein [Polychytrium aggregatum]KAI9207475.1 ribosomal protein L1-like protein [Polychytrium aggregatum]
MFAALNSTRLLRTASHSVAASSRILASHQSMPAIVCHQTRSYNRKRYLEQKKADRALLNQDDITFSDALEVFRVYTMNQILPLTAHIKTNKPDDYLKPIRGELRLPHQVRALETDADEVILVFAKGAHAEQAKALGAHIVGAEDLILELTSGKFPPRVDKVFATKAMFPQVVKIAKILGPKGLMPSPAKGTVSDDIEGMMKLMNATSKFEVDSDGYVHFDIAKTNWKDEQVMENFEALLKSLIDLKPPKFALAKFIESVNISSPHVIGVQLPLKPFTLLSGTKTSK